MPKQEKSAQKKDTGSLRNRVGADSGKGKKNTDTDDTSMMEEEQRAATRERIISRFLHLIIVGYFIDAQNEKNEPPAAKEGKPNKKSGKAASESQEFSIQVVREKASAFGGPLLMLAFICALFGARIAGEDFSVDHDFDQQSNFYEVLDVSSSVDVMTLRKAYKAVALKWHPDKNPDCEPCAEKFAAISKAYETLNDPDRRKAYDQRKSHGGSLKSPSSIDLGDEDFEAKVLRSNEVWYVQVYDPSESMSKNFHSAWEDIAAAHMHIANFGRLDATKHRQARNLLPQRVLMMPVVFRYSRGHSPEMFQWTWSDEDRSSKPFARFVLDNYPQLQRVESEAELQSFTRANADLPKIIITSPTKGTARVTKQLEIKQVQRMAHMWSGYVDFTLTYPDLVKAAHGPDFTTTGGSWVVSKQTNGASETSEVKDVSDLPGVIGEFVAKAVNTQTPFITLRNYQQLCGAKDTRTFCIVLVDGDGSRAASALQELNASRVSYAQEVLDLKSSESEDGSEATEESMNIQLVRLMTSSSRFPWGSVAAGGDFDDIWAEVGRPAAFVLELDTGKIAAIKTTSLREIYQQIAYEDLIFRDMPEDASLPQSLPDPEVSLRHEFSRILSTLVGSVFAFFTFAAAVSIIPELSLVEAGQLAAAVWGILMLCWPMMCRKCLAMVWCVVSPSSFECQV